MVYRNIVLHITHYYSALFLQSISVSHGNITDILRSVNRMEEVIILKKYLYQYQIITKYICTTMIL